MRSLFGDDFNDSAPANTGTPLPRRVLRHLVTAAGLGLRSRVLVGGDSTEAICAFLTRLGMDALPATDGSPFDAALWVEVGTAETRVRSLVGADSLRHSWEMTQAVREDGTFLFVCRVDGKGSSHAVECVERHLIAIGATPHLAVFPERPLMGFLGANARTTYAVSMCLAAACSNERVAASTAVPLVQEACCHWADRPTNRTRAA